MVSFRVVDTIGHIIYKSNGSFNNLLIETKGRAQTKNVNNMFNISAII